MPEATAQPTVRFERYELDSLFRIGCHTAPGWSSLSRDTLLLDFTYHYAAPPIPKLDSDTAWEHQIWRDLYYQNDTVIGGRPPLRLARQLLPMFIGPIPIYYVRPDKMARPGVDSTQWRRFYPDTLIAFNTPAGYARYTDSIQAGLGIVRDTSHIQSSTHWRIIPTLVRIVSASRFRYAGRVRDSVPVYNVVTVNGLMNHIPDSKELTSGWKFSVRPKTPEEIAVQSFISLNCGAQ